MCVSYSGGMYREDGFIKEDTMSFRVEIDIPVLVQQQPTTYYKTLAEDILLDTSCFKKINSPCSSVVTLCSHHASSLNIPMGVHSEVKRHLFTLYLLALTVLGRWLLLQASQLNQLLESCCWWDTIQPFKRKSVQ